MSSYQSFQFIYSLIGKYRFKRFKIVKNICHACLVTAAVLAAAAAASMKAMPCIRWGALFCCTCVPLSPSLPPTKYSFGKEGDVETLNRMTHFSMYSVRLTRRERPCKWAAKNVCFQSWRPRFLSSSFQF